MREMAFYLLQLAQGSHFNVTLMLIYKFSMETKFYKVGNLRCLDDKQIAYSDISLYNT